MPHYLGRFSYSTDAIKALVANPQDREKAAAEIVESMGAKLIGLWYALGEFDGVFLLDAPDNSTAVGLAMALGASGGFTKVETTALLSMDEAQEAMRTAQGANYRPPSSS
jgi:uncharacterized protein with GYD domain